ncbi:hypothetical protein [Flavobacterium taihuense]|uniref:Uncharacterized protein n=1 Tax=Flavobacterium taihuense TaxID=2857508 RepID=A0ABS6Y1M4_9FLAO|nr:hypothetical protein [Flavobacterium taihuense]MBW4362497.1 hypothetical protein [Flavobacterium taihuense]
MSSLVNVKVFYGKGIRLSIKNRSFKEAMNLIWVSPAFSNYEPLKIVFPETGKILYANKQVFINYINGVYTLEELIQLTQCEELFRNKKDFHAPDGTIIDAGSLWKLENKILYLIDDDNYYTTKYEISIFEIAE